MHEVLVNRLGGLSLLRKSVVRLTDRPDMTLDVYRGRKTTMQQQQLAYIYHLGLLMICLVFGGLGLIFKVKVLLVEYILNRWIDILQTCMDISLRQA